MKPQARWGIYTPGGWMEWEETLLAASRPASPSLPDDDQPTEVLLVDQHGKALIKRVPRPFGFRPVPR